ncbi:ribonucleoside-diphosphate reductase subunit alpha [Candidatus Wolfebacteria bacterium]|nr:ribonucleoside-diphosphate reductase subunit alpha [Candidatus Wolfebacteria bacterium]
MPVVPSNIRKRTGELAPFDADKITTAVKKAFFAVTNDTHEEDARHITERVLRSVEGMIAANADDVVPGVEDIQDLVEIAIMETGFYDVARAYIVYRFQHAKVREQKQEEVKEKIERRELLVKKLDGRTELFAVEKIRKSFVRAAEGYEDVVDVDALIEQTHTEVYDGITTRDIAHALVLVARSFTERDPAYAAVASRLLLQNVVYRDALGYYDETKDFSECYRTAFIKNIRKGVELKIFDERMLSFDLEKLAAALEPERDNLLRYLGTQTLFDRYFARDRRNPHQHVLLETPQLMWMRVAMGIAFGESRKEERAISFYNLISTLRYTPATPTLMNAGTTHHQLSSCYLGVIDDTLESIFKAYSDYSHLAKFDGGVGQAWTKLRGTNAIVQSTNISSNGVIPFLKILDSTVVCINRSGRRRGACSVYLEPWHIDFEDFIELNKNVGDERRRTPDLHPAAWIPDVFMERVRENAEWTLFSPDETPDLPELYGSAFEKRYEEYEHKAERGEMKLWKRVQARDLWKKMLTQLFETGHPWINFKDPSNIRSPQDHVGVVHNSNLCTEIILNTKPDEEVAVCNLGSVNIARHMRDGKLDEALLAETVQTAMRMLDNVIDVNFYPIPEARVANMRHRPVGLGIMGLQDALFMLGMSFDSEEAVAFGDYMQELVAYQAIFASSQLARERGAYQSYPGSKWDKGLFPIDSLNLLEQERGEPVLVDRSSRFDWRPVRESVRRYGMRNSNCIAIAPTATIANIAGCFPAIEPIYKNIYVKSNISGTFIVVNQYLVEDLKKEGLWNHEMLELIKGQEGSLQNISAIPQWIKDKHKEVFAIDPMWLVKAAAQRAKWIDQSQSLNIFYSGTSGSKLSDIYMYVWQSGLKTTYYLRTLGATAVEQSTVSLKKQLNLERRTQEAVEEVAHVKEALKVVYAEGGEARATVTTLTETAVLGGVPKLCKLDDPDCESCQ